MPPASSVRLVSDESAPTDAGVTTVQPLARPEGFPNFRRAQTAPPERKWQMEVLQRLVRSRSLQPGWDSYNGRPMSREVGFFAQEVLIGVMRPRTPMPQIVPLSDGGVQIEWHERGIDLEFRISAPYECELWFEDHLTGRQLSTELSTDFALLRDKIAELSSR
jgi:hypothetical protein